MPAAASLEAAKAATSAAAERAHWPANLQTISATAACWRCAAAAFAAVENTAGSGAAKRWRLPPRLTMARESSHQQCRKIEPAANHRQPITPLSFNAPPHEHEMMLNILICMLVHQSQAHRASGPSP